MARVSTRTLVVVLLILGLTLGILTAVGVYVTTTQAADQRAQQSLAPVVVPIHPISSRTAILATDVRVQQEHVGDVPPSAAVRFDQVVGKVALVNLYPSAPVLTPQVADASTARSLGYTLPQGLEAMALPTPDLVSGAGAISPGDRIDIIMTVPAQSAAPPAKAPSQPTVAAKIKETQFALQGIQVIGVGQVETAGIANVAGVPIPGSAVTTSRGSVTVLVTPQQALILTYAKDSGAEGVTINLVLRRPDDASTYRTTPVTIDYLRQSLDAAHP